MSTPAPLRLGIAGLGTVGVGVIKIVRKHAKLIEERDGNELSLTWQTEKGTPFPMPIEVQVDGKTILADMSSGSTVIDLGSDDAHYVIDPMAKVLRYSPSIARWQAWMVEQQEQAKKAKEEAKAAD